MENPLALEYAKNLVSALDGHPLQPLALEVSNRLQMPMAEVLRKIRGTSITARAKKARISRQTYYEYMNEETRPNLEIAQRLSKLTGIPVEEIRGRRD